MIILCSISSIAALKQYLCDLDEYDEDRDEVEETKAVPVRSSRSLALSSGKKERFFGAPEFVLNLDMAEQNVTGFMAFYTSNHRFEKGSHIELIDLITIHKQISDPYDFYGSDSLDGKSIKASLLPDKTGILWEEPSISDFMVNQLNQIYATTSTDSDAFGSLTLSKNLRDTHLAHALKIKSDPKRMVRRFVLKFPEGILGRMGYYNNDESMGNEVSIKPTPGIQVVPKEKAHTKTDAKFSVMMVTINIAVETIETRVLSLPVKNKKDASIEDLAKRMSALF